MLQLLIVDDEIHAVRGVKAGVQWHELGFSHVHEAYNIRQAKEIFLNYNIDVLICDIEMPEGDGFQLLTWVRENRPDTESFFLTCHADFEYARKAIQLGSLDYMLKPVRFPDLEQAVKKAINKRNEKQELNRFKETYNRYYHLWESHQPMFIERFWQDLLNRSIHCRMSQIRERIKDQQIPWNEHSLFLPILISVQRWHKQLTLQEEKIMEYALSNSLEELSVIKAQGQIVQVKDGALLAILTAESEEAFDKAKLKEELTSYIGACNRYFYCDLCCYAGTSVTIEGMPDLFDVLVEMESANVTRSNKVFFLSDRKSASKIIPLPKMNGWAELLKQGCQKELLKEIGECLETIKQTEQFDSKMLSVFYEDFLQMIYHVLHSKGLKAHQVFSEAQLSEQASSAKRSVDHLQLWIKMLVTNAMAHMHSTQESQSVVDRVKLYITQNIHEDMSRDDIANYVSLNPDYLTRCFKKEVGMTISEYVLQERIKLAKDLLAKTELSIGSIATSVGYMNLSHFSKMFKKVALINPQDYRRSCIKRPT